MEIPFDIRFKAFIFRNVYHLACYFDLLEHSNNPEQRVGQYIVQFLGEVADSWVGKELELDKLAPSIRARTCTANDRQMNQDLILFGGFCLLILLIGYDLTCRKEKSPSATLLVLSVAVSITVLSLYVSYEIERDEQLFDQIVKFGL